MTRYSFDFISNYNGKSDYRLFRDGRANTRITADHATLTLSYADGSPVLLAEVAAFNTEMKRVFDAARAVYPETGPAPVYRPALEIAQ